MGKTNTDRKKPLVGIIMGSDSDWSVMREAVEFLEGYGIPVLTTIVSAHRTPKRLFSFSQNAEKQGLQVIIAGAGGAAHLPGMVASLTVLPVIGVPVKSSNSLDGWDSLLSIVQMPNGVPVATVAVNAARNAGILALQILACKAPGLRKSLHQLKNEMEQTVLKKAAKFPPGK